jgi:hypothetical protein
MPVVLDRGIGIELLRSYASGPLQEAIDSRMMESRAKRCPCMMLSGVASTLDF